MKNQLKTALLLGVLTSILLGVGALVAPGSLWIFGTIAVAMNLISYFFSHKIVLAMHRAHEITEAQDPGLYGMVRDLAKKAGIPTPKVYVMDDERPNAFATGRNPAHGVVAVTTGIRRILSDRELRGVIAHELAHIKNRDILIATVAAMIASVVAIVASITRWGMILGGASRDDDDSDGGVIAMLVLAIVAPIAATIIQLAISRSREYLADETGGQLSGDPDALADALLKLERGHAHVDPRHATATPATASLFIVNPLRGGGVFKLFSTHPTTESRVEKLRAMSRGTRAAVANHPFGTYGRSRG